MTEEKKKPTKPAAASAKKADPRSRRGRPRKGRGRRKGQRQVKEFEQKILDLARVTRVTAGGKRMSFRCALVIGDQKGRVGLGVSKGADVQIAVEKAYRQAKRNLITVPIVNESIAHAVWVKYGAARVMLKPAPSGTGLKAGGAMRLVLEFAGVPNAVSKILNSNNKINIARATLEALKQLREVDTSKSKKEDTSKKKEEKKEETKVETKKVEKAPEPAKAE